MRSTHRLLKTLPFFSIIFTIMVGCSLRIEGYPLLPALFLIPVYYWLVFRPDWLSPWALFVIGLFYDSLFGNELGCSSILLVLSSILGHYIRPFLSPHHFFSTWGAFGLYSFGYLTFYGFFVSGGVPLFISWGYGLLLYPLVAWVLSHLHLRLQSYV